MSLNREKRSRSVEDENESQQLLMQILELEGFKAVGANGAEAMDYLSISELPCFIVLELPCFGFLLLVGIKLIRSIVMPDRGQAEPLFGTGF